MPRLAPQSFAQLGALDQRAVDRDRRQRREGAKSILWADTFNNYFHPETSRAALEVLQVGGLARDRAGDATLLRTSALRFRDARPRQGVPARASWIISAPQIDAGVPIVVLEPSCASVFRDELRSLFPSDERAERLRKQTFLLERVPRTARAGLPAAAAGPRACCCTATVITRR